VSKRGEIIGAVDFGSRDVRVLIARRDSDGSLHVLGHGTAPGKGCVSHGVIQDLNAARIALKQALGHAEKEARVKASSLFCGVNGRNVETFIREGNVKLEKEVVEFRHMEEALDIASRDILAPGRHVVSSMTAQEWYVDELRVIDPIGIRGGVLKARVHFARMPAAIEENLATCIESLNRDLEDVIFLPLASALGCLTMEDMELGVGVMDLGRSTTGLAVYRDYRILGASCFEWGGYHITRDVAAGLQVSFEEAQELILEYGVSDALVHRYSDEEEAGDGGRGRLSLEERGTQLKLKSAVRGAPSIVDRNDLDMIIFERCKELMTKVRQHLQARGLMKHLVRGIVLTGGAGAIRNQAALAEAVFQVPARIGLPEGISGLPGPVNAPEFVAVVGVLRHGAAFRAAARNGRLQGRGPLAALWRRLKAAAGRYFI